LKGYDNMSSSFNSPIIKDFKEIYDQGYRCILYEVDHKDNLFTVHLKNFQNERIKIFKCSPQDGLLLQNYIDRLS
jgi:hypothetical protein